MKTLVVYYSRTGTTRALAQALAEALDADIDEVVLRNRRGPLGFLRALIDNLTHAEPAVSSKRDPANYDLVVVGSPVWAGGVASPLRSYLLQFGGVLKQVAAFCASGSGGDQAQWFEEVERLTGRRLVRRLSVSQDEVRGARANDRLSGFLSPPSPSLAA